MKRIRLVGSLTLLVGLAILAGGCTRAPRLITSEPDFAGFITEIEPGANEGILGGILVESHADKVVDKYFVTIRGNTRIFEKQGEGHRPVSFHSLQVGDPVQLWFTGPILESFPAQATAQQVVIVESGVLPQATASPFPSSPTGTPVAPSPSPSTPVATTTQTYLGVAVQGGKLGEVWNLADVRYGVHPDRLRVVVEMVEPRDHVPLYQVAEVDNAASPFPTGHDASWGAARIDLVVSDLYAYDSPVFEGLPILPPDNPRVTRIGHYPTFDDSSLGFSIGLMQASRYEIVELTDPVRIVIDVLW